MLHNLINQDEGMRLEFKKSAEFEEAMGRTLCAFANAEGGILIFGIEKKGRDMKIDGIKNRDETYQKIQSVLHQLKPIPIHSTQEIEADRKLFVILEMQPLPISEICFFRKKAYKREGSISREISERGLVDFLKMRGSISYEENRSLAELEDMDPDKIDNYLALRGIGDEKRKGTVIEPILASIGVVNKVGGFYIKNTGILFFARDINKFFLNSEIRIVKYKGRIAELEKKESDQRIADTVYELFIKAFDVIRNKVGTYSRIIDGRRADEPMIPDVVLREALTNAIGHRDYFDPNGILVEIFDDRVQITNPGSLLPGQTLKNIAEIKRHRNPLLYRLLNDMRLGEGLALGIKEMFRTMRKNNLPDPLIKDLGGFFQIILYGPLSRNAGKNIEDVSERQKKALDYLKTHKSITAPFFSKFAEISHPTAITELNDLAAKGYVKKIGRYRSSKYIQY